MLTKETIERLEDDVLDLFRQRTGGKEQIAFALMFLAIQVRRLSELAPTFQGQKE